MTAEHDSVHRAICPHCGALAPPGTVICASCGIDLDTYQIARSHIDEVQTELLVVQERDLAEEFQTMHTEAVAHNRAWLKVAARAVLITGLILILLAIAGSGWYVWTKRQHRLWLQSEYEAGMNCLKQADYLCARNHLSQILTDEDDYADAAEQLVKARYGLAGQYVAEEQWHYAVQELDLLLAEQPGHVDAVSLRNEAYNRWIMAAIRRGDLLLAIQLKVRRDRHGPQ